MQLTRSALNIVLLVISLLIQMSRSHANERSLQESLDQAGENRGELERAIAESPEEQKAGMKFLVTNMPEKDLQCLSAEFLLENSAITWKALNESAWKDSVPEDVLFDSLLPYASINERRDRWRKDFYQRFAPLVAMARTPGEAAAILNQEIFPTLNVKYSTGRKKADQSPYETIESGLASCTGLSVLLVDACRAVGVPARIVGTPLWSDKSGNHTWVEVWDNGWHFTGACEPSGKDLDKSWFVERASRAQRDHQLHAIYAVTFRRNGQSFPMVWAREVHDVFAVNVTDRYTAATQQVPEGHGTVRVCVVKGDGKRMSIPVRILNSSSAAVFEGETKDERFDANDHLTAFLKVGEVLQVCVSARSQGGNPLQCQTLTVQEGEQLVEIRLENETASDGK